MHFILFSSLPLDENNNLSKDSTSYAAHFYTFTIIQSFHVVAETNTTTMPHPKQVGMGYVNPCCFI